MKRKVYLRADAGADIGYGHFIRTLALADMLKDDFDCTFFTQAPTEYQKREAAGVCRLIELPSDASKFETFLGYLHGDETVVLDNYFYSTEYQSAIKDKGCKLVCIDDMHDKHYVADVVVNHGSVCSSLFSVEPYTNLCLGLDWALLRRPFLSVCQRHNKEGGGSVAISFGGSDTNDFTGTVIRSLISDKNIKSIKAIVGDAYRYPKVNSDARVKYCSNLSAGEVCNIFSSADIVICSASTVCIEALFCGARVAAGWYADNQKEFYDYLESSHYIIPLGHLAYNVPVIHDNRNCILSFSPARAKNIRREYIRLFRNIAFGTYLRKARHEDAEILYEWINDREVRQNSFTTAPISYDEHTRWFRQALEKKTVSIYILVHDNRPVGTARFEEIEKEVAVISYLISKSHRNEGLGGKLIELAMEETLLSTKIKKVEAYIKDGNQKSQKILRKYGFVEETKNKYIFNIKS